MCAPAGTTTTSFALAARVGRTRQHSIFGSHPAFRALITQVRRQLVFNRCRTDHARIAHLDQRRTLGMGKEVRGDLYRTPFVERAMGSANKLTPRFICSLCHLLIGSLS